MITLISKPRTKCPPHLLEQWLEILNESERNHGRNYPRAMRMAAAWGVALAEWELSNT